MKDIPILLNHDTTRLLGRITLTDEAKDLLSANVDIQIATGYKITNGKIEIIEISFIPISK